MPLKNLSIRRLAAPFWGKRGRVTAAFQQDRTGVCLIQHKVYTIRFPPQRMDRERALYKEDHLKFKRARGDARQAIRKANIDWFKTKAEEAQRERFGGKKVWKLIRDMKCGRRGLVPSMSVSIKDKNGNSCITPSAKQKRWRRHFTRVLDVQSQFNPEEMEKVRQRPLRSDLAQKPS